MARANLLCCLLAAALLVAGAAAQAGAPAPEKDITAGLETCLLTPEALAK